MVSVTFRLPETVNTGGGKSNKRTKKNKRIKRNKTKKKRVTSNKKSKKKY